MMTGDRSLDQKKTANMVSDYFRYGESISGVKNEKKRYFIAFLQSEKWKFVPIYWYRTINGYNKKII